MSDTQSAATQSESAPAAATTTTPAAAQPSAAPAPAAKPEAAPAAPAKDPWADFKAPEGFTVDELKPLVEWAQKTGLDPKAAAAVALREKEAAAREEAEFKQLSEKGWLEELQKDPALGGEKIRETMVDVMRGADKLPAEIQAMIKEGGVLYNPIMVRVLHHFGTLLREDAFVRPGATPSTSKPGGMLSDPLESIFARKSA